jgi:hypothetical protein
MEFSLSLSTTGMHGVGGFNGRPVGVESVFKAEEAGVVYETRIHIDLKTFDNPSCRREIHRILSVYIILCFSLSRG